MKLGSFEIPEKRLIPDAIADIRKIYDAVKSDEIASKDLSSMLGYSHPTATRFYIRLNSMVSYGLIEGRGTFRVSALGKSLAYPENDKHERTLKNKAILNVSLWKEMYQKFQKSPPSDNFWVQIKNITGIEPQEAKSVETQVRKWYVEDVAHISEELLIESQDMAMQTKQPQDLSSTRPSNSVSQQLVSPTDPNSFGILSVKGIGNIDLTDADSIDLAESALKILRKKLPSMTSKSITTEQPKE